jgi:hypothetical protein
MKISKEIQEILDIKEELSFIQNQWNKKGEWLLTDNLNKVQLQYLISTLEQFKKGYVTQEVMIQTIDNLIDVKINDIKYGSS